MNRASALLVLFLVASGCCSSNDDTEETTGATTGPWYLLAEPVDKLERIIEQIPSTINLTLCYNGTDYSAYDSPDALFIVRISMSNSLTLKLSSDFLEFTWEDVVQGNNKTLEVLGQVIGYIYLNFQMEVHANNASSTSEEYTVLKDYLVTVVRQDNTLDNIFTMYCNNSFIQISKSLLNSFLGSCS